ncbi:hypothetical protein [Spiroplasma phoeniceum]|uniref:Uncharacterized protein n=1 Tax=Spiroplasma phoeniceum P40 TaxID=1276259 RepID=A0A345DM56_9MOLU|nr:hypothetical protein [Spiroplasma phoeniceum]AXF95294.1 hypothetical protein SDAV_00300 [Spiroplasma phoeniceum P40]
MKFLKETIRLIKNNEEGVRNQTLWNNIGCHIEGDISHYCKGVLVKKATYHEKTLKNKLNTSMMNFKNKINLFNCALLFLTSFIACANWFQHLLHISSSTI